MSLDEKKLLWEVETCIQQKRFREAKELLSDMEPIDIAEGLEDLPSAQLVLYFRLLPKDLAVEVFEMLDFDEQERFLAHATGDEVTEIIEEMSDDDRTELFDELPATTVKRLLLKLSPEERRLANTLLGYPEDSAGRIMTPEYIALKAHMTVKSALERIREKARSKETIYTSFVTDEGRHLLGAVELEDLILADPDAEVIDIMNGDPVSVATSADQEQAAQIISRYDLHTLPVVDSEKRLVGIITFDDVLDVVEEEATEDIERMAGIEPVEEDYLDANLFTVARKRFVWLVICIITEALTSTVLKHYSPLTQHVVSLTFFVPLLIGTGGNAGTQAATLMIRGMTVGEIQWKNLGRIIAREAATGVLLGSALGLLGLARAWMIGTGYGVAVTVGLGVLLVVLIGNLAGTALPLLARALHIDPAIMSGPFITTVVDIVGLIVYFETAGAVLGLSSANL
ncbi:MAG: magnesium transporter [Pyramidobacter sp.]|nr:magnesium transporter [Pyramidobacter sp.]MBQ8089698.1 magnesium transporter [Pyramidobacter sp.]MBQ9422048.1 magnesium transporter [Pyramidobacter sp.]MBR0108019.1 magnesium transporter [Pyramidobacter sp.]